MFSPSATVTLLLRALGPSLSPPGRFIAESAVEAEVVGDSSESDMDWGVAVCVGEVYVLE